MQELIRIRNHVWRTYLSLPGSRGAGSPNELLRELFYHMAKTYSLGEAAAFFQISQTTFRVACRLIKVKQWPHRKYQSVMQLVHSQFLSVEDKNFLTGLTRTYQEHYFVFPAPVNSRIGRLQRKHYKATTRASAKLYQGEGRLP